MHLLKKIALREGREGRRTLSHSIRGINVFRASATPFIPRVCPRNPRKRVTTIKKIKKKKGLRGARAARGPEKAGPRRARSPRKRQRDAKDVFCK